MKKHVWIFSFFLFFLVNSCQNEKPWQSLFNVTDLNQWDLYLGKSLNGFEALAESATVDKVFSVVDANGEKMIRISGEVNGSLATRDSFANYHLRLVYKWGQDVYTRRNSGLLYHSFGAFGEALDTWMVNIECQMLHGRLGDTYLMNNTCCETAVGGSDGAFQYATEGAIKMFSKEHNGQVILKSTDAENPVGEWNTIDLYCFDRTSVHVVNGVVVMVNNQLGTVNDGVVTPLTGGKIQLQSEGAEWFLKSIDIRPIRKIPEELLP